MNSFNTVDYVCELPVLNKITKKASSQISLGNIKFVCVQHLLFTTIDLIKSLIALGALPSNIHILGKVYSTSVEVEKILRNLGVNVYLNTTIHKLGQFEEYFIEDVRTMWKKVARSLEENNALNKSAKIKSIIVLDDGGKCICNVPKILLDQYCVYGVEQTSSGISYIKKNDIINIPVVEVATSAIKQQIESEMIANAVMKRTKELFLNFDKNLSYGIIGMGAIGKAMFKMLKKLNIEKIVFYDKNTELLLDKLSHTYSCDNIQEFILKSDYIIGCTGEDITCHFDLNCIKSSKIFISCSSQDVEFKSLLKYIDLNAGEYNLNYKNVLEDIEIFLNNEVKLTIIKGGYPVNLDNSGESVPAQDIQLTRGLLLGGVIQAFTELNNISHNKNSFLKSKQFIMLDPNLQILAFKIWSKLTRKKISFILNFSDFNWIKQNSKGEYREYNTFLM